METKVHCASGDTALSRSLADLVGEHLPQLDRITKKFPVRSLLVSGERHRAQDVFELKISLILENHALTTSASSTNLASAASLAFRKLHRQLRVWKENLRHSRTFEKVRALKQSEPRPEELLQLADELEEKVRVQDYLGFRQRLADILGKLETFVRRELHFVDGGERLTNRRDMARDIVEEALLHTFEKFQERPNGLHPEKWIFRHALELISAHVDHAHEELLENEWTRSQPRGVSTDAAGSAEEDASQEELLDEIENFPVEIVDFETISSSASRNGSGEDPASAESRREWLQEALDALPRDERKALFLCFLEGFKPVEAAAVLGTSEERLRLLLEQGAARLRRELR